jgi:histidinol-phosphate aminotransferase
MADRASGASLLFLARPNAPTGLCCSRDFVAKTADRFPGVVWVDEAYADFADDTCLDFVRDFPNLVVSRTLSKSYSLAGIRLGLAVANPDRIGEMMKVKDSYNVGMLTQALGVAALADRETFEHNRTRIRATRERLSTALVELGFEVLPSSSNFVFARPPVDGAWFQSELKRNDILIRHFAGGRTGAFVRISVGTDAETDEFLRVAANLVPSPALHQS